MMTSCIGGAAFAQSPSDNEIPDIVVTAQKSNSTLQKTPLAISAVSQETLISRGVTSVNDLPSLSPGLVMGPQNGNNRVFIRGVGLTSVSLGQEASISFNLDGIAIGRPSAQMTALFDIDRIEVLRGPQGTLYGRNATAGAVNVYSTRPTRELDGYFQETVGNYGLVQEDVAVSGPLNASGTIRARLAGQAIDRDGYGRDITYEQPVNDQRRRAVRASLDLDATENLEVRLTADYAQERDHDYIQLLLGTYNNATIPGTLLPSFTGLGLGKAVVRSQDYAGDEPIINRRVNEGVNAEIDLRISDSLSLKSLTGYRYSNRYMQSDADATSARQGGLQTLHELSRQFTQEFQANYTRDRFKLIAGLYYYHEYLDVGQFIPSYAAAVAAGFATPDKAGTNIAGTGFTDAYAAFAQADLEVIPKLTVTAGIRYSDEHRASNGIFSVFVASIPGQVGSPKTYDRSWNAVTPKFGIRYEPTSTLMLYASATRGFKSGVVFFGSPSLPVNPEYVWDYEAGVKSSWFGRRLTLNLDGFYYDYKDLQVAQIVGGISSNVNAASARVKGIEGSLQAIPVKGLTLQVDFAYLDARFRKFLTTNPNIPGAKVTDLAGNRLAQAPEWSVNYGFDYNLPLDLSGTLTLHANAAYRSRAYFAEFNELQVSSPPWTRVDLSLDYRTGDQRWTISAFVKNLTDKFQIAQAVVGAPIYGRQIVGSLEPPRTFGARLRYNF